MVIFEVSTFWTREYWTHLDTTRSTRLITNPADFVLAEISVYTWTVYNLPLDRIETRHKENSCWRRFYDLNFNDIPQSINPSD